MTVTDLDRQLAELRSAAYAYAARHQFIPDLTWPDGVRIAVNFTCDFDAMLLRRLLNEPPMQLAKGEFGGRVGIWRLVELFDAHSVKATIFTPGRICELYPQALGAVVQSGHEIADHMWEHRVPKEPVLEEDHLAKTVAALERVAGRRPIGTRSSHSAKLLRQYGYIYRSEGSADQRPHYEFDEGGGNGLINLPMHYVIDDAMYFNSSTRSTAGSPTAGSRSAFISAPTAAAVSSGKAIAARRLAVSRSAASPTPISRCRPRRAGKSRCTAGSGCCRAPRVSRNLAPEGLRR
jgi:peptidoglycan/xylan/chitin deacetylase (PgdA/CDA1 family)